MCIYCHSLKAKIEVEIKIELINFVLFCKRKKRYLRI